MRVSGLASKMKEITIRGAYIPIGTVFSGDINGGWGLFLRTYSGIVDLQNPTNTWTIDPESNELSVGVQDYQIRTVELQVLD